MNTALFELADQLKAAKDRKKQLADETKANNVLVDDLEARLAEAMASEEVDRFSRNGSLFYLSSRLFASPKAGMKEDMIAALKGNGYADLVIETVPAGTLASFAKERIEASETGELPGWLDAVVSTYEKVSVGIRRG